MIRGTTRVAAVIGWPVEHSRSPQMFAAAAAVAGLDAVMIPIGVPPESLAQVIGALRAMRALGASVTVPHKLAVAALCDELSPAAREIGAVNCLRFDGDRLIGHNTDCHGFTDALVAAGFAPDGKRCVILGAGGAARAVAHGLRTAAASSVDVIARRPQQVTWATARPWTTDELRGSFARADLVVDATTMALGGGAVARDSAGPAARDSAGPAARHDAALAATHGGGPAAGHHAALDAGHHAARDARHHAARAAGHHAAPDARHDVARDARHDVARDAHRGALDAMPSAAPDAMSSAAPDAMPSAAPDAMPDAMPDTPVEALPLEALRDGAWVSTLVYHRRAELLERARRLGYSTLDGRGMLVHQGARAFALWTGAASPAEPSSRTIVESMRRALEAALAGT